MITSLLKSSGKPRFHPYPISTTKAPTEYLRVAKQEKSMDTPKSPPATLESKMDADEKTKEWESIIHSSAREMKQNPEKELELSQMTELMDKLEQQNLSKTPEEQDEKQTVEQQISSSSSMAIIAYHREEKTLEREIGLEEKADMIIAAMSRPVLAIENKPIVLDTTPDILLASQNVIDSEKDIHRAYANYAQAVMNFSICYEKSCQDENGEQSKALRDELNQLLINNNVPAGKRSLWLTRGSKIRKIFVAANKKTSIFAHVDKWSRLYQLEERSLTRLLELINQKKPVEIEGVSPSAILKSTKAPGFDIDHLVIDRLKSKTSWLDDKTVDGILAALLPLNEITLIANMGFLNEKIRVKLTPDHRPSGVFGPPMQSSPLIVAPYNVNNNHWVALIIKGYDQTIQNGYPCQIHVFDSYYDEGLTPEQKKKIVDVFVPITVQLKDGVFDIESDHFEFINEKCQRQSNQHDCGVHTIWTLLQFAQSKTDQVHKWAETVPEFNSTNYRLELIEQLAELMHQQDSTFEVTQWTQ